MAESTGRLHIERSGLRPATSGASFEAGNENITARLRVPGIVAVAAIDRRMLGVVETGWRQKAGEQHDRGDAKLTPGGVRGMAVIAAALLVEDDPERSGSLLSDPSAPPWGFTFGWCRAARKPASDPRRRG